MHERLRRLLLVVPVARARPGISIAELAAALDCDVKELRRDLDLLACVGAPPYLPDDLIDIELRDDRVWVTLPQAFSRPARLLATEASALALAVRALAPHDAVARAAVAKLALAISPQQRELYEGLVNLLPVSSPDAAREVEAAVAQAIQERREIRLEYYSPTERAARPRVVRPRQLVTLAGVRYLSARRRDGQERQYRLDRIARACLLKTKFAPLPTIDLVAAMARVSEFEKRPDLPRAMIRFEATVAEAARMRHPDARQLAGGRLEAELPYSTLPWLISYAFSWGGNAVITGPATARRAFRDAIQTAAAAQTGTIQRKKRRS